MVCPVHQTSDTRRPDLWVNVEKGVFHCLSTKCAIKGSSARLIQLVLGGSLEDAARSLALSPSDQIIKILADLDPPPPPPPLSLSWTQVREKRSNKYWVSERGLSPKTCDHFNLGYDLEADEALIPFLNQKGEPVCFIRRRMTSGSGRYMYPKGFSLVSSIFHLSESDPIEQLIVVEGAVDAMKIWQAGFPNVVALLGSAVTVKQINQLLPYRVVSFFDNDDAGISATKRLTGVMGRICRVARYPKNSWGKDPDGLSPEEITHAIRTAIASTSWSISLSS